jgi:hypothetical protein
LITAGQAFHWFDPIKSRAEFRRILKPGGWVLLVWNDRRTGGDSFAAAYEQFLQDYNTDMSHVRHQPEGRDETKGLDTLFGGASHFRTATFINPQSLDFGGLKDRVLSSSYMPAADHPGAPAMLARIRQIFDEHQVNGIVTMEYDTRAFYGQLA